MAVPFLTNVLPDATIAVEVAWGADVNATYASWSWTDITADVRASDGISLKHGRGDEADFAQPASCSLVLDNSTGAYSIGGQSPNWPNVVKNTPLRVLVDPDGNGATALFIGYADSWQPVWDHSAQVATVRLTASGILRRLAQHDAPVLSSLRRRLSTESNVVAYWPLEDGKLSGVATSALLGHPSLVPHSSGEVDFAADTETFASTVQMAVLKNGGLYSQVPTYTLVPATGQQFRCLLSFPDGGTGMTNDGTILRMWLGHSSLHNFDVLWTTGGGLKVQGYSITGTKTIDVTAAFAVNGKDVRLFVEMFQSGANVNWKIGTQEPGSTTAGTLSGSVAATLAPIGSIFLGATNNHNGLGVGQVVIQNAITSIFDDIDELDAFEGEASDIRFERLLDENGIESYISGDTTPFDQITDKMGEQRPEPLMTLLKQVQEVDRGIIFDGLGNGGLTLQTRRAIESMPADLTVDVAAGELASPLMPIDDDQRLLNRAVVSRQDGVTAVYEDVTGPLGTGAVGTYDSSLTIPVESDAAALQYASWLVSLGTIEGYRYPSVDIDLLANPGLIEQFLDLEPGYRVDLVNITGVATQHPDDTVELIVQGFEQHITPHTWRASITCTPYGPWEVGRIAEDSGLPTSPHPDSQTLRLDTDGSTLNTSVSAGATSLSVATTSGPLWTTSSSDMPFDIEVGGIPVTVTAISGASSPQTFTVTGVTKALTSGLAVQLYDPLTLGL